MAGQKPLHQRVLRRKHDVGHAAQRVDAGGEALHLEGLADAQKPQGDAVAATDPIALHGAHAVRPFIQAVQIVQERLRVVRGLEEPLRELLLLDGRPAPLARPVHHLLVGQHGDAGRAPVDRRASLLGQSALEQLQKDPLRPAVIARMTGRDLARPVEPYPPLAKLCLELADVVESPLAGMDVPLNGGVLGGEPERVPAHRGQDLVALHDLAAHHDVAQDVIAAVSHVKIAGGVRKHVQAVVLRLRRTGVAGEEALRRPPVVPLGLEFAERETPSVLAPLRRLGFNAVHVQIPLAPSAPHDPIPT